MKIQYKLAKDTIFYGSSDFATKLLALMAFPLIANFLTPESFGELELILTTVALIGVIVNFGINNSVQRYYWEDLSKPDERIEIVTSGLTLLIFSTSTSIVIMILILLNLSTFLNSFDTSFSEVALVGALFVMGFSQLTQYFLDLTRLQFSPWKFFLLALTSRTIAIWLGVIGVCILNLGVDGLILGQCIALCIGTIIGLKLTEIDINFRQVSITRIKQLVNYGYPFIFAGLSYWLFTSMDRWMLMSLGSTHEVGIYSIGVRFASIVMFISIAFGQAWSPLAMKIRSDFPDDYRKIYGDILLSVFLIMMLFGGMIAVSSQQIINFFMPEEFSESAKVLAILALSVVVLSTQQVTAIGISIERRTLIFAWVSWFVTGVNFGLNLLWIPKFGVLGAAWSTLISHLLLTLIYMFFTQRLHPIEINKFRMLFLIFIFTCISIFVNWIL